MKIFIAISFLATTFFMSCAHVASVKPDMLFISGSHMDQTSWNLVTNELKNESFSILLLDRWGRDADKPASLSQIAENACSQIGKHTVVVAHSFGGSTANEMLSSCPDKIAKIIYVAALIPLPGENPTAPLAGADQKLYMSAVLLSKDRITPKSAGEFATAMDLNFAKNQKTAPAVFPESMRTLGDQLHFSLSALENVKKYYVFTSEDKIIAPSFQKKMAARAKITDSESIESGHLPMLSAPKELAAVIKRFAK